MRIKDAEYANRKNNSMINVSSQECCSQQMLLYMEVSSTALVLLMALVAPLRNWLNSPKSPKRLKVFNFNLEYETFCELTQPKLFKTFSRIKRKRNVFLKDFLIFPYSTFYFRIQYLGCPNNVKYMKTSVILSM